MGSRFWPVSTPSRPKQLLPLASDEPLVADTLRRARALAPADRIRILAGEHLLEPFRSVLPDLPDDTYMVEPRARGTAPVLTWAAWTLHEQDPEAVLVSLHSDHVVEPEDAFRALIRDAARVAADEELLLTVAVEPDRPETGYGYIRPGDALPAPTDAHGASVPGVEAFRVDAFVEKPDRETAAEYLERGYLWNSGIFVWKAAVFLDEVRRRAPEIGELLPRLEAGDPEGFFAEAPKISVDEAVLERSDRVGTVKATFRWDDVGSWGALARTRRPDEHGNVAVGPVHAVDSRDVIAWSEDGTPVVLFGVEDLVVVRTGDVTLVADRSRAPRLKELLAELPEELRKGDA